MGKQEDNLQILEKGRIYFLYRPRVEEYEPDSQDDLQQLYMVLSPKGKKLYRLGIIGREQLPDPGRKGKARYWGFIEAVTHSGRSVMKGLGEEVYQTKTRGTRHQPAARPAGEGVYEILRHNDHTHLVYALDLPKKRGEVQQALNIEEEASYIISIRNPDKPSSEAAGIPEGQEADFPEELRKVFRDRKFADADPPEFLDHEGAEFLLIAAAHDPEKELGIELDEEHRKRDDALVFRDLRLHKSENPVKPLFEGTWE